MKHGIKKKLSRLALTSKCDLDLGGRGAVVVHDISSYYCNYLLQVFSNTLEL
jgi:hypothetical protein